MRRARMIVIGICILLLANIVHAQQRQRQGVMKQRGVRLMEELNLSAEQKDKIHQIRTDNQKKNIETNAQIKVARLELRELVSADDPDKGKIDDKISLISQLQEEKMSQHVNTMLAVKEVLTPEQREKAKELKLFQHKQMRRGKAGMGPNRQGRFGRHFRGRMFRGDE